MSRFGSQHRSDENQGEIVSGMRRVMGCTVAITSGAGAGFPDLVVGRMVPMEYLLRVYGPDGMVPMNFLMEVKHPRRKQHRPKQMKFKRGWHGQVATVLTLDQALATIGVFKDAENHQRAGADQETERPPGVRGG